MDKSERDRFLSYKGHWYAGGSLGEHLEIHNAMRKDLWLWTMRPNDVPWEQVQLERRQRQYTETQAKRRRKGVRTRAEYEANSARAQAAALGISRRTYYRLGLHKTGGTGLSPVSPPVGTGNSLVPRSQAEGTATLPAAPSEPSDPALAASNIIDLRRPLPTLPAGWPYCARHIVCTDRQTKAIAGSNTILLTSSATAHTTPEQEAA